VITRLARVGYDFTIGFLEGGFASWQSSGKEVDHIDSISADQLATLFAANNSLNILDVRKASEFGSEHIKEAENAPLDFINESMAGIDKNQTYYVHCAGGYRSMIFISILKARGFDKLIDVKGGFKDIKATNKFNITDYVCPTTLLQAAVIVAGTVPFLI
jgi:rhodanese-related sulfurtransferase